MIQERTHRILLAVACCLVLVLLPMTAGAQIKHGIQKGVEGVGKGVEYGVDKTKEGAKAVGNEVKKPFTDDDSKADVDRQKADQDKSYVAPSQGNTSTSSSSSGTSKSTTRQKTSEPGNKNLPRTAGEAPLLALVGTLALAAVAASRISRRNRRVRSNN